MDGEFTEETPLNKPVATSSGYQEISASPSAVQGRTYVTNSPTPEAPRSSRSLWGWWLLNIAIVVFVFLAFLFAVLAYTTSNKASQNISNAFQNAQSLRHQYKVGVGQTVKKGTIVSFCDNYQRICTGLGPRFNHRAFDTRINHPAALASLAQVTPSLAVYAYITTANHTTLRIASIVTSNTELPNLKGEIQIPLEYTVTSLHVTGIQGLAVPPTQIPFVVMYTDHNTTYLQVGLVAGLQNFTMYQPVAVFVTDPNAENFYVKELSIAEHWIILTYGQNTHAATYAIFEYNNNVPTGLSSISLNAGTFGMNVRNVFATVYIGNNTLVQSNADEVHVGAIDWAGSKIDLLKATDFPAYFRTLHITTMNNNRLLFSGVQTEFVDDPLVLAMVVETSIYPPYLSIYYPTNLLATVNHQLLGNQLHTCYEPPSAMEPGGGVFFTYVDVFSRMPKIVRSKIISNQFYQLQLLPSPSLDLGTNRYGAYQSDFAPLLSCPTATNEVLIAFQDFNTLFDTFNWVGGYRYAGIVEQDGKAGDDVWVVREGISPGHENLYPGFEYYAYNDGYLAPHTATVETFTPNGNPVYIGVAISPTELLMNYAAFEHRD